MRSEAGEKFSDAPRLAATRRATISPSAPATMSPLRSVGSFSILTGARPIWSLPLHVHPDQLVAVAKRIRQFGIRRSVLGSGIIDIAAVDHFGLARRAK